MRGKPALFPTALAAAAHGGAAEAGAQGIHGAVEVAVARRDRVGKGAPNADGRPVAGRRTPVTSPNVSARLATVLFVTRRSASSWPR